MNEGQLIIIGTTLWDFSPDAILSAVGFTKAYERYDLAALLKGK